MQRWALGYDVEALVREYGVLRHCILAVARDHGLVVPLDDVEVLSKCLNVGIAEAVSAYVGHRDAQLASERVVTAAKSRANDEFVAMVSHELRTPLNAILGWLRLLRDGTVEESKRAHAFDVIERNALAQERLVADLLDMSKVINGTIVLDPEEIDLAGIVTTAIAGMRTSAAAKRIGIEIDVVDGDGPMQGDGGRLHQVIWNLVSNAVKFTPKGGKVLVRLRRIGSDLELLVEDDGEGIEPAFLPHVFESFRQSDTTSSRRFGGLGVGLSLAKHLVELHGGRIAARSGGRGQGSTFEVRLPA